MFAPGWLPLGYPCESTLYRNYIPWEPLTKPVKCEPVEVVCPGIEIQEVGSLPEPPGRETLEENPEEELSTGSYPDLNRLLNYVADPEFFPPPTIPQTNENLEQDHRCDRSIGPIYENPTTNSEPYLTYYGSPFAVEEKPPGYGSVEVYLRQGESTWEPGHEGWKGSSFLDLWDGWGYRHIVAKHGWDTEDYEETKFALEKDLLPLQDPEVESKWAYKTLLPKKGAGGVECFRVVVVDYEAHGEAPAPRGIVTSFNEVK